MPPLMPRRRSAQSSHRGSSRQACARTPPWPGEDELAVRNDGLAVVLDWQGALDCQAVVAFGVLVWRLVAVLCGAGPCDAGNVGASSERRASEPRQGRDLCPEGETGEWVELVRSAVILDPDPCDASVLGLGSFLVEDPVKTGTEVEVERGAEGAGAGRLASGPGA